MADKTGGAPKSLPNVPAPQNVQVSPFEMPDPFQMPFQPVSGDEYLSFSDEQYQQMLQQQTALWDAEMSYMMPMAGAMYDVQAQYAPMYAQLDMDLQNQYAPQYAQLGFDVNSEFGPQYTEYYNQQLAAANPQFMPAYNALGETTTQQLGYGYDMGAELEHEVEQSIRSAQAARGNVMGAAPTAQEAFGMGQASLDMYNTRVAQSQGFINGQQPTDMWGELSAANAYQPAPISGAPTMYPESSWMNPTVAPNVFGTVAGSQSAYNSTAEQAFSNYNATSVNAYDAYNRGQIGAAEINNTSAFDAYNASFDQFLYGQSVQNGLYSTPSVSSGGSSMMGGMGSAMGGLGAGMAGLATSGLIGTGATAAGVGIAGAAAGAAAAICWLARKIIPSQWRSFRKWVFTKATNEERQDYIYNSRRLANAIP